jgi:site-specific recombinase XerD
MEQKVRRERILAAQAAGLIPTEEAPKQDAALTSLTRRLSEYLAETKNHKSWKTFLAYRLTMQSFVKSCDVDLEQISRDHIMTWMGSMKEAGLDPRTIGNRTANLKNVFPSLRRSVAPQEERQTEVHT